MAADCSSTRKRRKLSNPKIHDESTTAAAPSVLNETDIISTLPDCLLCHILSFLPNTASIVATTSILSRRWRYLWKDLQTFHFIRSSLLFPYYCTAKSPFFASVKTFLSLRTARGFRKFQLSCHIKEEELSTVNSWVETAIGSNLEEVHFQLSVDSGRNLVMPDTIFNCTKLVNLFLGTSGQIVTVLNRSSYHFPSLKIFYLVIESSNNLEALLSDCTFQEEEEAGELSGFKWRYRSLNKSPNTVSNGGLARAVCNAEANTAARRTVDGDSRGRGGESETDDEWSGGLRFDLDWDGGGGGGGGREW
ncbi:hypothetical protein PIB30_057733 [Stylosanthes scabra]|uniref:F-box domain-containing protein n=1 Tax=Stylosanthes scabra TaxID=79078 RepID=A0ABU6SKI4_9FABA|nr:hypothetical protein [Stylosanthes scabra]